MTTLRENMPLVASNEGVWEGTYTFISTVGCPAPLRGDRGLCRRPLCAWQGPGGRNADGGQAAHGRSDAHGQRAENPMPAVGPNGDARGCGTARENSISTCSSMSAARPDPDHLWEVCSATISICSGWVMSMRGPLKSFTQPRTRTVRPAKLKGLRLASSNKAHTGLAMEAVKSVR